MPYLCLECYEVYNTPLEYCPKASCGYGAVVEIDELMLPTIKMLNEKGYCTENCCSGHVYESYCSPYIQFSDFMREIFDDDEIESMFADLPKMWHLELNDIGTFFVRASIIQVEEVETYEQIVNANLELLHFVDELPCLEY